MDNVIKIGIDLGTTNTVVCYEKSDGEYDFIKFGNEYILPSVAFIEDKTNKICVGKIALKKGLVKPSRFIKSSKTHMGEYGFIYPDSVEGMKFDIKLSPTDIATNILKEVKRVIEAKIPDAENSTIEAIITTPAYFERDQKEETTKAGEAAGLKVKAILTEPASAAVAYVTENIQDDAKIFVVDFGGGTLDITLLQYNSKSNTYEEIGISGDNRLGGDDVDNCVIKILTDVIKDDTGIDLSSQKSSGMSVDDYCNVMARIRTEAIKTKIELSEDDESDVDYADLFDYDGGTYDLETSISIDEFNEACQGIYNRIEKLIRNLIADRNINVDEVDRILLVGGSCYIPKIKEIVADIFDEDKIYDDLDLSKVVALGACIVSNQELIDAEGRSFVQEITAYDFGVEVIDPKTTKSSFSTIIERNRPILEPGEKKYKTLNDEPIMVNVYERGSTVDVKNTELEYCSFYGSIEFQDFEKGKGGAEVNIRFEFDIQQRLTVTITDLNTQKSTVTKLEKSKKLEMKKSVKPMDLFVLVDSSGSMYNDLNEVKRAACNLVDTLDMSVHRMGVIQFDDNYRIVSSLTNDMNKLKRDIHTISSGGCTYIAGAFRAANDMLLENPNRNLAIIMLTDGEAHDPVEVEKETLRSKASGIRVISIGAGSRYNEAFLNKISSNNFGESDVYKISKMSELTKTFETIANSLQEI